MLGAITEAARRAGDHLLRRQADRDRLTVERKGRSDFVTAVDRESEDLIASCLEAHCPGIPFLAEESADRKAGGAERWIVDPLDGTTNFLHGYPCFAVSIALQSGGRLVAGAVFNPVADELFAATGDTPTTLNGDPVSVSTVTDLAEALLTTGFPFKLLTRLETYLAGFSRLLSSSSGVRRDGSAALDLCAVAAGRADGFWEFGLAPWDVAAGGLLVRQAGGRATDVAGGAAWLEGESIVAATPGIHERMLALLAEADRADTGAAGRSVSSRGGS
ncbi:MAG: inositol monophosphatase family protein [Acidobacteriota bacterium]